MTSAIVTSTYRYKPPPRKRKPRAAIEGPAIVIEDTATTVVPPLHTVTVDDIGSLIIRAAGLPTRSAVG